MQLTPLQLRILVKLAKPGRMTVDRLLTSVLPRKLDISQRSLLETEIRLQIDLLILHGLITQIFQSGERYCVAPPAVVRWLAKRPPHASRRTRRKRVPLAIPVITASLMGAAGCTHAPSTTAAATPAPVVTRYNAEGTPPPDRMEQFYNPRTGNMVYRFCVGKECPEPTPKRPLQRRPVVTEINPDGSTEPVAQVTTQQPPPAPAKVAKPKAAATKNDNGASLLQAAAAKTPAADAAGAAPASAPRPAVQSAPGRRFDRQTLAQGRRGSPCGRPNGGKAHARPFLAVGARNAARSRSRRDGRRYPSGQEHAGRTAWPSAIGTRFGRSLCALLGTVVV